MWRGMREMKHLRNYSLCESTKMGCFKQLGWGGSLLSYRRDWPNG